MYVQIMRRDRPKFASGNREKSTPEEVRAAFEGFLAYYGSYQVNESENTVVHRVEVASFPNWVGTELRRHFQFLEERLILKAPDSGAELVWSRTL